MCSALHSPSQRSHRTGQQSKHVCDNRVYITMCYTNVSNVFTCVSFAANVEHKRTSRLTLVCEVNGPEGKQIELLIMSPICYSFQYSSYNGKYEINWILHALTPTQSSIQRIFIKISIQMKVNIKMYFQMKMKTHFASKNIK